ncbi:tumor necrosis factor receptor superfamily member 14-like isoform X18 [Gadus macrocephalus]|uniref:tumor necrosis factor receptor superfamily member 14-like isoform X18 n=1 Tax=Gadus macrocephalus TaxID=80720 RepID=UPI0028CB7391|nr:tumor necrosis factor receptor superfamily member 14-like isoform X18 [Gadus macrocephalus]
MLNILMVNTNWKMFFFNLEFIFKIYLGLLLFHIYIIDNATASANCRPAEYSSEEGCCPTCPPGMHVNRHCTEFRSTSCASCTEGTFQDGNNGREQCFSCKHCDAGLGLKEKKSCSSTSDAVCEVLDGFFCSDSNRGGCRAAQRHTVCSPGQYIGQRGTADKDTECLHCTDGTFSDGTSSSCQNHTKCESVGLKLIRPGTDSTDSECGEHGPHAGLVAGIVIPGVMLVMALMALIIAIIHRKNKRVTAVLTCDCVYHYIESTPQSKMETQRKELSQDYRPTEQPAAELLHPSAFSPDSEDVMEEDGGVEKTKPLRSTDGPEPTRDQPEHTITIPETIAVQDRNPTTPPTNVSPTLVSDLESPL